MLQVGTFFVELYFITFCINVFFVVFVINPFSFILVSLFSLTPTHFLFARFRTGLSSCKLNHRARERRLDITPGEGRSLLLSVFVDNMYMYLLPRCFSICCHVVFLICRQHVFWICCSLWHILSDWLHIVHPYLIFVIFFTGAKFLDNRIYTEKR